MSEWIYVKDGRQSSPCTSEEIIALIEAGALNRESIVWKSGLSDWKPLADVDDFKDLVIQQSNLVPPPIPAASKTPRNHAWRRFLAKTIDVGICSLGGAIAVILVQPEKAGLAMLLAYGWTVLAWFVIESITDCRTVGRMLLGIKVQPKDNADIATRSITLLAVGMGFELPLVSVITKCISYFNYRNHGTTLWDKGKFDVNFGQFRSLNIAAACFLIVVIITAHKFIIGYYNPTPTPYPYYSYQPPESLASVNSTPSQVISSQAQTPEKITHEQPKQEPLQKEKNTQESRSKRVTVYEYDPDTQITRAADSFSITLPSGWVINNLKNYITIVSESKKESITLNRIKLPNQYGSTFYEYAKSGISQNTKLKTSYTNNLLQYGYDSFRINKKNQIDFENRLFLSLNPSEEAYLLDVTYDNDIKKPALKQLCGIANQIVNKIINSDISQIPNVNLYLRCRSLSSTDR